MAKSDYSPALIEFVTVAVPFFEPSNTLVAVTVSVVFDSVPDTVKSPLTLIVLVTSSVPVTVQITSFGAKPVFTTTVLNCVVAPFATVTVEGETVTLVIAGVSVVNKTALLNGLIEKVFHTW